MNLLSRLPIIGKGSYEPNFKVEFHGGREGLERVVDLALRGGAGQYSIGEIDAAFPAGTISVEMQVNGNGSYALTAHIGNNLRQNKVNIKDLEAAGFNVVTGSKGTTLGEYIRGVRPAHGVVFLKSPKFPKHTHAEFSSVKQPAELRYAQDPDGLIEKDVICSISEFAHALEAVVNSVYHTADKKSPQQTLYMVAGEEIRRIQRRPTDVTSTKRQYRPKSSGEKNSEGAKISLETVANEVTFADIGGYQGVKDTLDLWLKAVRSPEAAKKHGYVPARGILLHGPPGTGKTLFGKAIAGESGAQFFYVDPTELLNMYVGESPKALRQLFENAGKAAKDSKKPVIVFMDEIDTILMKRGSSSGGSDAVTSQLVNVFNQYMDGFQTGKIQNVFIVAATNRFGELDSAAVRPPRFVHVEVPLPDLEARTAIFQVSTEKMEKEAGGAKLFSPEIDYASLAKQTEGFSGADIATFLTEVRKPAFKTAVEKQLKETVPTTQEELEAAIIVQKKKSGNGKGPLGFVKGNGGR